MKFLRSLSLFSFLFTSFSSFAAVSISGNLHKWQPLTIDVNEPEYTTTELAENPNPFLDIALTITFTSPSGETFLVPGFFAGDGQGNGTGSVWRVRFAPNEKGLWNYQISFLEGDELAIGNMPGKVKSLPSDGLSGQFEVSGIPHNASGFNAVGRLGYDGHHYLKFADGGYWIKGGIDSPENFFAYAGFDNTTDQSGGAGSAGLVNGIHRYGPHAKDWNEGDPNFQNEQTGFSGKNIIGVVNYLSDQGVNSMYFLPMNLGGDGRDTFPFVEPNGTRFSNTHYDVSKLYQWNLVLNHMQNKGVAVHMVLAEQEKGNTNWLDNGNLGTERKLYYKELIARFGYLLALKWNLSEESRYGHSKHKQFAKYIRGLDWADHPLTVHTDVNKPQQRYEALLGNTNFDTTSIQYAPKNANDFVEIWRKRSSDAGWPWVIDMDENAPAREGLTDTNADELRKEVLYPVYFSGGNIEWYFGYHALPLGGDIRTENFRTREPMYRYMRYARKFMLEELPFKDMNPADHLHSKSNKEDVQIFAKNGEFYAVYLPKGTIQGELTVDDGTYALRWFNPVSGQLEGKEKRVSGEKVALGLPPTQPKQDWVVLLRNVLVERPQQTVSVTEEESASTGSETPVSGEEEPDIDAANTSANGEDVPDAASEGSTTVEPSLGSAVDVEEAEFFGNDSSAGYADKWLLLFMLLSGIARIKARQSSD